MRAGLVSAAYLLFAWAAVACWPAAAEESESVGAPKSVKVLTGIDVLAKDGFKPLEGLRLGLLTHKAGKTADGRRTIDVLAKAPGVNLVALFSPEHGLGADREGNIAAASDAATGLPIHSLYGASKRPTPEMLASLDAIAIDLQDVGVRFYTYATTMAYVLEEAAKARIKVIVLDRPNPIGGAGVTGPVLDADQRSFVGYFQMPIQHGMTMGELARLFNAENAIGADLTVVAMQGYARASWFDGTGLPWESPSPNLRRLSGTVLYPGIGALEFTDLSVGRGTATPFELVGAPWVDGTALAKALQRRHVSGVRITSAEFTPKASKFKAERCFGVRLVVEDRRRFDAVRLGVEIAVALRRLHPDKFETRDLIKLLGSREAIAAIDAGKDPAAIVASWKDGQGRFQAQAAPHLLY
ncbi:MAG: DUF1343 domain-containing protein [Hyphomicrobiales bacterium]|nr:MAG: DUF1343 domain-containing protein [Hyphomicrobiales bacterium]